MQYSISPKTLIGTVHLTVQELNHSLEFYQQVIGFQILQQNDSSVTLGTETTPLLKLSANPQAQRYERTTGLYHFAILVPDRIALSQALQRIARHQAPVQGFADHGVSEAIYLADPDGNGIEIYRDRQRDQWPYEDGQLKMVTDPLDVEGLFAEVGEGSPGETLMPQETKIGHMHLHVRAIPEAESFYRDVLGFNLIQRYGSSAAFLAAGDYHHHIGINTWAGVGAPAPPEGSLGLRHFSILLTSLADLDQLAAHIEQTGVNFERQNGSIFVSDPSSNRIELTAKS